ncbi:MAG: hypothetical protein J5I65_08440 [Aridibacter famidurans]|nr:hypothetical protein [Aridibacter famidurans]
MFIEDDGFREIDLETLKERKKLAFNGVVSVTVTVDPSSGEMASDPVITLQGVGGIDGANGFRGEAAEVIADALSELGPGALSDIPATEEKIRLALKRFIKRTAGSKPLIIPRIVRTPNGNSRQ